MGKIIYQPAGSAGEYAKWAANFYNGCSARCEYCYNRKGITAKVLGGDAPTLKKCLIFKNDEYKELHENYFAAKQIFMHELRENREELLKHGLFFNFVSDPCLPETFELNKWAWEYCLHHGITPIILTKQTWWVDSYLENLEFELLKGAIIGFTLTGHDELEPGAATNMERIKALKKLYSAGFKTWASIEPIIDFKSSFEIIENSAPYCNYYKIGLQSGKKYHYEEIRAFLDEVFEVIPDKPIYLKDSLLKQAGIERNSIDLPANCVIRDFKLWK